MNARVDHLLDQALALAPSERSALLLALLDNLEGEDDAGVSEAWARELDRRRSDWRAGRVQSVSWEHAKRRLIAL